MRRLFFRIKPLHTPLLSSLCVILKVALLAPWAGSHSQAKAPGVSPTAAAAWLPDGGSCCVPGG